MTMIFQLIVKLPTDKASLSALRDWKSVTIRKVDPFFSSFHDDHSDIPLATCSRQAFQSQTVRQKKRSRAGISLNESSGGS